MLEKRKKEVYEVCRKYGESKSRTRVDSECQVVSGVLTDIPDVIICEDEPYYCLFAGKWAPQKHRSSQSALARRQEELEKTEGKEGNEAFIKALPPTFLTVDYEGRVIRMDVSFVPYSLRLLVIPLTPWLDLLQDVLSWITIGMVYHFSTLYRATHPSDRVLHSSALWIRHCHDYRDAQQVHI